jgi:nucleoid-associated protein YgaU
MGAAEEARLKASDDAARQARDAGVGGSTAHPKFYTVKRGDTLSSIAADQLGDYRRWTEIADLNDIRDPRRVKVGQTLRLP